jgi:hypothetical protein
VPNEVESRWLLNLYPEAAEAGGCLLSPARPWNGRDPWDPDEERSAAEAIRRARGAIRRYCAANRLNRLGTLTYAGEGQHDARAFRADLAAFFRRLRTSLGEALPYLWVPEWHPSGHGLHAHFAVGRYVRQRTIHAAWGHGFVHIKLLGDLPVGSGAIEEARLAARYLSKYVGKDLGAGAEAGLHRYDVGQGFQPRVRRLRGRTLGDVLDQAAAVMGGPPVEVWDSADDPSWDRAHAVWARWA